MKTYKATVWVYAGEYHYEGEPIVVEAESLEEARQKIGEIATDWGVRLEPGWGPYIKEIACLE